MRRRASVRIIHRLAPAADHHDFRNPIDPTGRAKSVASFTPAVFMGLTAKISRISRLLML